MPEQMPVKFDVRMDCPLAAEGEACKRVVRVTLSGVRPETGDQPVPPLNVALVIDRSGSMGGPKLRFVKEAAQHLLDRLSGTDQVSVVTYDDEVTVAFEPQKLHGDGRERAKQAVAAIREGGSTALFDGWLAGAERVAGKPVEGAVTRVFLLTDGLANQGETRQEVLEHHARELFVRGVATSTFGVGTDFNQFLLEGMAAGGGGSYRFIESPQQIPAMFGEELGDLLSTSARSVSITVGIPAGASVTLLGDLPHTVEGGILTIPVGDVYADQERSFYLEALLPPRAGDAPPPALSVRVVGTGSSGERFRQDRDVSFAWAAPDAIRTAIVDTDVLGGAARVQVAAAEARALRLEFEGRGEEGGAVLRETYTLFAPYISHDESFDLEQLSTRLLSGERLTAGYNKGRQAAAYKRRHKE
jgi:Ca-activated chloride channel family protein